MKQILILLSILFALFGASTNTSYANLDTIGVSSVIEHCNTLEG